MTPHTFVISLPSQPERWARCEAHLTERGYRHFVKWDGIDAEKMGLSTKFSHTLPDGREYNPPSRHVGCALSHWLTWKGLIVNSGQFGFDRIAIMEDDVELRPDWEPLLCEAMSNLPEDWDILFAGSCHAKAHGPVHYKGNLWRAQNPLCSHFYIVRAKALPVLIESCERIYTNIDWAIAEQALPKLNHFTVLPRIAGQHGMEDLPE